MLGGIGWSETAAADVNVSSRALGKLVTAGEQAARLPITGSVPIDGSMDIWRAALMPTDDSTLKTSTIAPQLSLDVRSMPAITIKPEYIGLGAAAISTSSARACYKQTLC